MPFPTDMVSDAFFILSFGAVAAALSGVVRQMEPQMIIMARVPVFMYFIIVVCSFRNICYHII